MNYLLAMRLFTHDSTVCFFIGKHLSVEISAMWRRKTASIGLETIIDASGRLGKLPLSVYADQDCCCGSKDVRQFSGTKEFL